ncbi:MAG: redoxin domain-containing protein [Bacteroidales bacterium]|nr:redoxin domain-containing protein [Bacteroidales bacterium]
MLKKIILVIVFLIPLFALGQKKGFRIDVQIKGWENKLVYFEYHYGKKNLIVDSLLLGNSGKAFVKSDSILPGGIYMIVLPQKAFVEFIMDENNQFFSISTDTSNIINHLKFKNSPDNEAFLTYQQHAYRNWSQNDWYQKRIKNNYNNPDSINKINDEIEIFNNIQNEYRREFINQHKNSFLAVVITALMEPTVPEPPSVNKLLSPEAQKQAIRQWKYIYYKNHYWDNIDFSDARLLRTTLIENKINSFFTRIVPNSVDSIIAESERLIEKSKANTEVYRFVLNKLLTNFEMSGKWNNDNIFVVLANKYYLSGQAPWADSTFIQQLAFRVKMMTPTLLGKRIPTTVFTTMDDSQNFVIDTISAKIILLYFWSSDCEHCKEYTPKLHEMYERYKDKGVKVVAITATTNFDEWRQYVKAQNYTDWIDGYYKGDYVQLLNLYDVYMTPRIFIIDKNKTIIQKDLEVESIEKIIKRHLR